MKKLTLIILIIISQLSYSQVNYFLPLDSGKWEVYNYSSFNYTFIHTFFLNGDSIFNNNLYKKLYATTRSIQVSGQSTDFIGLIRQDSLGKVFFIAHPTAPTPAKSSGNNFSV